MIAVGIFQPGLFQPYSFFARVGRMMPLRLGHLISSNHRIQTFLSHHMWRLGLPLVTFIWIYVVVTIEVTISSNPVIHKSPRFAASFGQVREFPFIQSLRCESAFRFFPSSQLESLLCRSTTTRALGCDVRPSEGVKRQTRSRWKLIQIQFGLIDAARGLIILFNTVLISKFNKVIDEFVSKFCAPSSLHDERRMFTRKNIPT